MTLAEKQKAEKQLYAELVHFSRSPLYRERKKHGWKPVLGEGNLNARIMFVGEAPGETEVRIGRPFSGRAGRLLDDLLASVEISRADVYITNAVNDRPPGNRAPTSREVRLYSPFLLKLIDIIRPRVLVPLGATPLKFVLTRYAKETKGTIGKLHGKVIPGKTHYGRIAIIPLYHPASIFYNRKLEAALKKDIQILRKRTI